MTLRRAAIVVVALLLSFFLAMLGQWLWAQNQPTGVVENESMRRLTTTHAP